VSGFLVAHQRTKDNPSATYKRISNFNNEGDEDSKLEGDRSGSIEKNMMQKSGMRPYILLEATRLLSHVSQ